MKKQKDWKLRNLHTPNLPGASPPSISTERTGST
uniref:Uncharacterized protein n=1 Tax=Anguilla anguilla TaxID=7936 RepID=A0A0E9XAF4_ANGAN